MDSIGTELPGAANEQKRDSGFASLVGDPGATYREADRYKIELTVDAMGAYKVVDVANNQDGALRKQGLLVDNYSTPTDIKTLEGLEITGLLQDYTPHLRDPSQTCTTPSCEDYFVAKNAQGDRYLIPIEEAYIKEVKLKWGDEVKGIDQIKTAESVFRKWLEVLRGVEYNSAGGETAAPVIGKNMAAP